jgi:hypothetical protein
MNSDVAAHFTEPRIRGFAQKTANFQTSRRNSAFTRLLIKLASRRKTRLAGRPLDYQVLQKPKNPRFSGVRALHNNPGGGSKRVYQDSVGSSTAEVIEIEPDPFGDLGVMVTEVEEHRPFSSWSRSQDAKSALHFASTYSSQSHFGRNPTISSSEEVFGSPVKGILPGRKDAMAKAKSRKNLSPSEQSPLAQDDYLTFSTLKKRDMVPVKQRWRPLLSVSESVKARYTPASFT